LQTRVQKLPNGAVSQMPQSAGVHAATSGTEQVSTGVGVSAWIGSGVAMQVCEAHWSFSLQALPAGCGGMHPVPGTQIESSEHPQPQVGGPASAHAVGRPSTQIQFGEPPACVPTHSVTHADRPRASVTQTPEESRSQSASDEQAWLHFPPDEYIAQTPPAQSLSRAQKFPKELRWPSGSRGCRDGVELLHATANVVAIAMTAKKRKGELIYERDAIRAFLRTHAGQDPSCRERANSRDVAPTPEEKWIRNCAASNANIAVCQIDGPTRLRIAASSS